MHRRRMSKAELLARMPRAFRPKLTTAQLRELGICHNENWAAVADGTAEPSLLWDFIGGVLTWWKVSRALQIGEPEMDLQLDLVTRLVERFGRTNRVRFDGPDLQLARVGVMVMDQLAELVDQRTATAAVDWSEVEVNRIAAEVVRLQAQGVAA